jgi:ketosteroid isomerase-like protein
MIRMLVQGLLMTGLSMTIFLHASPQQSEKKGEIVSKEEIMALENGAMERWRRGDPWGWTEISAAEVTYVDPGIVKPVIGLEEYKAYLKQIEGKVKYEISEFVEPRVARYGDVAVLTYNYRDGNPGEDGQASLTHWNTTEVYCRLDGRWRIIHTHWSYIDHKRPARMEVPVPVTHPPEQITGVAGELLALEAVAMERWRKGDPDGFLEISAPEVTYFDSGTPRRLDGLAALKAEYEPRRGRIHFDVMEFIDPVVQVHGDAAVLFYRFFSTDLNPDGTVAGRTPWNCTEVYAKKDGKWMIVHTHWSYIKGEIK